MTRRMLINAQRPDEVRIAIVSGKILDQYEVAATESGLCRGNIYRGIVNNIQTSLDAAFVDFGEERDGLLRADDVVPSSYRRRPTAAASTPASTGSCSAANRSWSRSSATASATRAPSSPPTSASPAATWS